MDHTYILDDLDEQDCRRLLAIAAIGRVGFTQAALPRIRPVHFTVRGNEVVIGDVGENYVATARRGDVVAFEADSYNPSTGEGWSVSVIGSTRLITDTAEIAQLDALRFAPWTVEQGRRYVAIPLDVIHGRRLSRQHADALTG